MKFIVEEEMGRTLAGLDVDTVTLSSTAHGEGGVEDGELVLLGSLCILGRNVAEQDRHVQDVVVEGKVIAGGRQ